jgi:hypothetical protein
MLDAVGVDTDPPPGALESIAVACATEAKTVAIDVAINNGVATNAPGPVAVAEVVAPAIASDIDIAVLMAN